MGKRWYGSVNNRLEEGRNYTGRELKVGDDITVYLWSDRHCKYITEVVDQKHIFVKDYYVCADHDKGYMSNDWMYFKSVIDKDNYLKKYFPDHEVHTKEPDNKPQEWMFRYGHWNTVCRFTQKTIEEIKKRDGYCRLYAKNEKEQALLDAGKEVVHYDRIDEGISFGVRDYYYDYEF